MILDDNSDSPTTRATSSSTTSITTQSTADNAINNTKVTSSVDAEDSEKTPSSRRERANTDRSIISISKRRLANSVTSTQLNAKLVSARMTNAPLPRIMRRDRPQLDREQLLNAVLSSENLRKLALQEQLDDIYFQSQPSMIEQHQQQEQESFQLNTTSPASITSNNFNINDNTNNISIGTNDSMNIIANNESVDVARRAEFKHSPPKQHQSTHHCTATASTSTIEMEKTNLTASSSSSSSESERTMATRDELECGLCFRLFYQPTTTDCGHTFCLTCFSELMRHSARCALCREPLPRRTPSVNIVLRSVIEKAFPDEFEERVDEGRREVDFFRSNDAVYPSFER